MSAKISFILDLSLQQKDWFFFYKPEMSPRLGEIKIIWEISLIYNLFCLTYTPQAKCIPEINRVIKNILVKVGLLAVKQDRISRCPSSSTWIIISEVKMDQPCIWIVYSTGKAIHQIEIRICILEYFSICWIGYLKKSVILDIWSFFNHGRYDNVLGSKSGFTNIYIWLLLELLRSYEPKHIIWCLHSSV